MMCGGNDSQDALQELGRERAQSERESRGFTFPFLKDEVAGNIPELKPLLDYNSAEAARSRAPLRASLARRMAQGGIAPNSPAALQTYADFEAGTQRGFDQGLAQTLLQKLFARQRAAQIALGGTRDPVQAFLAAEQV